VRAVAAEALTPAAAALVASAESRHVTAILLSLWDILLDLDDLSPSTSRWVSLLYPLHFLSSISVKLCLFTLYCLVLWQCHALIGRVVLSATRGFKNSSGKANVPGPE
jgi:hypothetical protein